MPPPNAPTLFYQSSMPRAGSTLLQNIIAQNPDFYVTPTSGLLELIYGARATYTGLAEFNAQDPEAMKKAFLGFCRAGMEGYFRALTDKPYALDKSRGWSIHFDLLTLIWGVEPKIICMVRDLRQILASMEKNFRQNPHRHRPLENHAAGTGTTTIKRTLSNLQSAPVGVALDRIAEVHQRGWSSKMLFLRYEDFTAQPAAGMKKVYAYLGLPEYAHDFNHVLQATQEDDQVHGTAGLHDIRPKVEPLRNDFEAILGRETVRYIETNYAWYFKLFDYAVG